MSHTPEPRSEKLPPSVRMLDTEVIAEHPDGHRIVGRVVGCGTSGVVINTRFALREQFLSYERGWSVRLADSAPADLCHNGHPFEAGIDADRPHEPGDPRWCDVCGEARRSANSAPVERGL